MCRGSSSISRPANSTRRCGRAITKTIRCFVQKPRTGSTSSGSRRTGASTPCAPGAAESATGAGTPDPAQATQQRTADALLTEVLQEHRGKLADHAAVHAQSAKGVVQVVGVLDV